MAKIKWQISFTGQVHFDGIEADTEEEASEIAWKRLKDIDKIEGVFETDLDECFCEESWSA